MRSNGFIAANEDIEHFRSDKEVHRFFDGLSIGFCQGQCFDSTRSKPFYEFVIPIFDQGAGTYDDDAFGDWFTTG
jgi:hypothetical protein